MVNAGCQDRWEVGDRSMWDTCRITDGSRRHSELFVPGRPPPQPRYASRRIRGRQMTPLPRRSLSPPAAACAAAPGSRIRAAVSLKSPSREMGEDRGGACVVAVATPSQSEPWAVAGYRENRASGSLIKVIIRAGQLGQGSWCRCSRNMEAFRRLGANEHTQHVVAPGSYSYQQSSAADARVQVSSLAV